MNRPIRTSSDSVRSVAGATLLSRVLGLARDIVTVNTFSKPSADALILAWTVPNLFRRLLGEGALAAALAPAIARAEKEGGAEQRDRVTCAVVRAQLAFLVPLTLVVIGVLCFVPERLLLRAFESEEVGRVTLRVSAWMFPYVILVCVGAQLQALANFLGKFFVPAVAPALVNVLWITGVVVAAAVASDDPRGEWVAGAVLLAGVLQLLMQLVQLHRAGARWHRSSLIGPEVREVLGRAMPMLIGLAASQVNLVVDRALAEAMVPGDGAVRHLYLANRLMQLPLGLVGISLATAAYPVLARAVADERHADLGDATTHVLRLAFAICMPAAVGLVVLSEPIVQALFERGAFDPSDTVHTAACLLHYAPTVLFQTLVLLLARVDYARDRSTHVMRISMVAVAVNVVLDLLLVRPFGAEGLALATTCATFVNAILLAGSLHLPGGWLRPLLAPLSRIAAASAGMAVAVLGIRFSVHGLPLPDEWKVPGPLDVFLPLRASLTTAFGVAIGGVGYLLVLRLLDRELAGEVWQMVRGRRRRRPDPPAAS